jgi:ABC-type branched-subunit amino acid transport system ATPase component
MELISIKHISKSFDGTSVLKNLSLTIDEKDIVLLEGENGAGKSTLFNMITQMVQIDNGEMKYKGESIQGLSPLSISRKGIIRLHQDPRVFKNLNVVENLFCAKNYEIDISIFNQIFNSKKTKQLEIEINEKAKSILKNFKLEHLAEHLAGSLSYGQQKLIAFTMIAMTEAELILLDEPFAGLNPKMIDKLVEIIKHLNQEGKTFVIIEHNIKKAKEICSKHIVLENGVAVNKNMESLC